MGAPQEKYDLKGIFMKKILFIASALIGLAAAESRAHACGACIQPNETPSVVTDHRMIFSISKDQSTLYDQIRYSGSPSSFGWVLPVVGDVEVGVSSDLVFAALDQNTQTQIFAPPQNCPPIPQACLQNRGQLGYADGGYAPSAAGDSVTVLQRKVVGPYDTVILKATEPTALFDWAQKNGFVISDDSKPVVAEYQKENFNFLAVKLVPSAGVQDMRPIRVTTKGANVALPLRMVAVGAGATLGITLWVLSEGRMEPTNFATFSIGAQDLAWDWTANKSNYLDLRAAKTAASNGRAWELESSIAMYGPQLRNTLLYGAYDPATGAYPQPLGDGGYSAPNYEADGQKSAEQVRDEDIAALFGGASLTQPIRITRLRADLGRAALDQDLTLGASADQNEVPTIRRLTKELNEPQCPVYSDCQQVGTAPRSQAAAQTSSHPNTGNAVTVGGEDDGCSATRSREGTGWMAAMVGFFAFAMSRKLRRRRS
jgi:hypothetical protein